jgi:hypothetical protein
MSKPYDLLTQITDETSFIRFLTALREECEAHEHLDQHDHPEEALWTAFATKDFLRAAEDWARHGDFAEGRHYDEPMLRRVGAMLLGGKWRLRD